MRRPSSPEARNKQIRFFLNKLEHIVHKINLPDFREYEAEKPPRRSSGAEYSAYDLIWSYYKLGWTKLKGSTFRKNITFAREGDVLNKNAFALTTPPERLQNSNKLAYDQSLAEIKSLFTGSPNLGYIELVLAFSAVLIRILNTIGFVLVLKEPVSNITSTHLYWIDFSYVVAVSLLNTYVRDSILLEGYTTDARVLAFKQETLKNVLEDVKTLFTSECSIDFVRSIDSLSSGPSLESKIDVILNSIQNNNSELKISYNSVVNVMKDCLGPAAADLNLEGTMTHRQRFGALPNTNYGKLYSYARNTLKRNRGWNGHNLTRTYINAKRTRKAVPKSCPH